MQTTTVDGRLVYKRAISKRLVFYDLEETSEDCATDGVELVLKADAETGLDHATVRDLRDSLKLGDTVRVVAQRQPSGSLLVSAITVLRRWREECPGVAFRPRASVPRHARALPAADAVAHPALAAVFSRAATLHEAAPAPAAGVAAAGQQPDLPSSGMQLAACLAVAPDQPSLAGEAQTQLRDTERGDAAAPGQSPPPALCKYWTNTGSCAKGDTCTYLHAQQDAVRLRELWIAARRRNRRLAAAAAGDPHAASALRKGERAAVFCDWLVATFGVDLLRSGTGVLDIAGGRGEVAFELHCMRGIRCTLIDPRPLKLSREQRRRISLMHAQNAVASSVVAPGEQRTAAATASSARGPAVTCTRQVEPELYLPHQMQCEFGPQLWTRADDIAARLRACSVVVGMHPDQATESIVDFATAACKPFAVVPCCVFPRMFLHRQLKGADGRSVPVVTHPQLLDYLQQKAGASRQYLPFEGMNQVVFKL